MCEFHPIYQSFRVLLCCFSKAGVTWVNPTLRLRESNPGPLALDASTLPHRHKSALVQRGRTSLVNLTTLHYGYLPIHEIGPVTYSPLNFKIRP